MSRGSSVGRVVGDIVRIDLGDGLRAYARVLEEGLFAFYDSVTRDDLSIAEVLARAVLFYVPVMNHAITSGRWKVVGHAPLEPFLQDPPPRFMQDALNKSRFRIYNKGKIRPATKEECLGLEREAAWEPTHVEDRLRDYQAGRTNKWVESLKIKE